MAVLKACRHAKEYQGLRIPNCRGADDKSCRHCNTVWVARAKERGETMQQAVKRLKEHWIERAIGRLSA